MGAPLASAKLNAAKKRTALKRMSASREGIIANACTNTDLPTSGQEDRVEA